MNGGVVQKLHPLVGHAQGSRLGADERPSRAGIEHFRISQRGQLATQRHADLHGRAISLQAINGSRRGHADSAVNLSGPVRLAGAAGGVVQQATDVAAGVVRGEQLVGRAVGDHVHPVVHPPAVARVAGGDPIDELDPFRVVGPQGHDQRAAMRARRLELDPDHRLAPLQNHRSRLAQHQVVLAAGGDNCQAVVHNQLLLDLLIRQATGKQGFALGIAQPEIDRPAVLHRRDQPAGIDDGIDRQGGQADGRPIPMGQIDVAERECPGNERNILGIELPLDPVGPDPIEIVLDGFRVDDPAGMKEDARPQQLNRFGHFRGLREAANPRQPSRGIAQPIRPSGPLDDEFPGQELEHY